jgi:hypothetical protein
MASTGVFVAAAATTMLAVRAGLALTGYPRLGRDGLHVSHVVWGGLFLAAALLAALGFSSPVVRRVATVVGGVGFGLFIDEIGKFITADYDYFFHRTAVLAYLALAETVVAARLVFRRRALRPHEHLAAAGELAVVGVTEGLTDIQAAQAQHHLSRSAGLAGHVEISDLLVAARPRTLGRAGALGASIRRRLDAAGRFFKRRAPMMVLVGTVATMLVSFGYYVVGSALNGHGGWIGLPDRPAALLGFLGAIVAVALALLAVCYRAQSRRIATWAVLTSLFITCPMVIAVSEFAAVSFAAVFLFLLGCCVGPDYVPTPGEPVSAPAAATVRTRHRERAGA